MEKSKTTKTQSNPQPETPASQEPKILAIKPNRSKQDTPQETESNLPKATESASPEQNQPSLVKPPVRKKIEIPSQRPQETSAPYRFASSESKEEDANRQGSTDEDKRPRPSFQKPRPRKVQSEPQFKNLEQATNSRGETFVVGEQVKARTSNFGEYTVTVKFLYEALDGSVWASYSPADKEEKHPWRWGCCQLELLKKE